MIIPDINLLIYAYDAKSPFQERAGNWWTSCLSGQEPVGIAWAVALGFVRLWTNPRVFNIPMTVDQAAGHVESWLAQPAVIVIHPGVVHAELVFSFLREHGQGGNLTTDAHLAALAVEHHGMIHTADTDFLRFPGVRWSNPITGQHSQGPIKRRPQLTSGPSDE